MTAFLLGGSVGMAVAISTGMWGFGGAIALVAGAAPWARSRVLDIPWSLLTGVLFVVAAALIWQGAALETVLLGGLVWLFLQRVWSREERVAALVAGLVLVVVGTTTRSVGFLPAAVVWVLALPGALGRERMTLALPVLALAVPLFWMLPRLTGAAPLVDSGAGLTGFADDVNLGAMDALLDDPARVFTASFSVPPDEIPYFRGVALDRFDGRRWWTEAPRAREEDTTDALDDLVRLEVKLEAHPEGVLFVAGEVYGLDAKGVAVERDEGGAYHLPGPPREVAYTVFTSGPFGPGRGDPFVDAAPRTELPELPDAVRRMFEEQLQGAGSRDERMNALASWLRRDFTYTREPRDMDAEAPLETFLLERREGHCEYFASALAVGGRVVGVPTRLVNGFVGGEAGADGSIVVRRYHAHSWVEYFDGDRWVTLDATPAVDAPTGPGIFTRWSERVEDWWDDRVVAYDAQTQVQAARSVADVVLPFAPEASRGWLGAGLLGLAFGLLVILGRRLVRTAVTQWEGPPPQTDPVSALLKEELHRLGSTFDVPPHLPDLAQAQWIRERDAAVGESLEALAWLAYGVRFGGDPAASRLPQARELVRTVRNPS